MLVVVGLAIGFAMKRGWNPREPFTRKAPEVERAIAELEGTQYEPARARLSAYLGTGPCTEEGTLALSENVRRKPDGSFDLGLALFHLAESYGARFGAEDVPETDGKAPEIDPKRKAAIECGRIVALAIASDADVPADLRARASFLAGNLEFLRQSYEEAVKHYDRAIELVPGISEKATGDGIGRDVAWNRAIALRRIEEKKQRDEEKKKNEPPQDKDQKDQDQKDKDQKDQDQKDKDQKDQDPKDKDQKDQDQKDKDQKGQDQKDKDQKGQDPKDKDQPSKPDEAKGDPAEAEEPPEAKAPPSSRMLDDLREAPSYQEENAKRDAARVRRGAAMEDK
jgi:hypothetical protein